MQQPPGRPGPNPQRPGGPPPGHVPGASPPPGGYGRPQPPPQYQQPQYAPPPAQAVPPQHPGGAAPVLLPPAKPRKSRVSLRFLASTCIFSGWFTLIVSILFAGGSVVAGMSTQRAFSPGQTQYFPQAPAQPETSIDVDGIQIPTSPGGPLGGGPLGGGGAAMGGMGALLDGLKGPLFFVSAVVTLVTGVVSCLLFLGLGQVCYVLLDLEEQTYNITQTLQLIGSRLSR